MARSIQAWAMLFALAFSPVAATDILAQVFSYTGGTVKGIKVNTDTFAASVFVGPFKQLASSELTVHVNAGDSDLFVYEIVGQFEVLSFDEKDYVDLQARVNDLVRGVLGGPAILQPQTVPTSFVLGPANPLNAPIPPKVFAMGWATRLGGGSTGIDYTFTIWSRVVDLAPVNSLVPAFAQLSNRTVKLTRYN